jgi:hypothetical protein
MLCCVQTEVGYRKICSGKICCVEKDENEKSTTPKLVPSSSILAQANTL